MKNLFVPYELAVKLKEKGFDYPTFGYYGDSKELRLERFVSKDDNVLKAPLYQQVQDWFREKHKIHVAASPFFVYNDKFGYQCSKLSLTGGWTPNFEGTSYYDAFNKAIEEALKFI